MNQIVESAESVGMSSERLERIGPALQKYIDHGGYAGFNTLVYRRGQLVHAMQSGWQDREASVAMSSETIFRIYSMTKPIICTALMMLYEQGRFQLVDPVAKFIPAFGKTQVLNADGSLADQNPQRPMQIRDLLSHSCGLTYDFFEEFPSGAQYREQKLMHDPSRTLEQVIAALAEIPLAFHPGTQWHYGLGTDVAAHLIEVLSGQSCRDFLTEQLLTPLGMNDTDFGVPETKRTRLATMYGHPDLFAKDMTFGKLFGHFRAGERGRQEVDGTYPVDAPEIFQRGGIGLFSTAADYMSFARMLLDGRAPDGQRLLSRKTLALMHTNHLPPSQLPFCLGGVPVPGWGFGLGSRVAMDVGQMGVSGTAGEFGWSGAAKTYYWVDPAEELVGVLMTQFMVGFDLPENDFRATVYQAIDD